MGEIFKREAPAAPLVFTGERLTTDKPGQIEFEHLHRYFVARELCRDLDVLDVAAGEGYGSAYLAQCARSVVGAEITPDVVIHAGASYRKPNLAFTCADARHLPFAAASFDVVTSFETIEHFAEQDAFLDEVTRVLRPGGLFIVSSPDRDIYSPPGGKVNEFHVKELSHSEFAHLLRSRFSNVVTFAQRPMTGSLLVAHERHAVGSQPAALTFERRDSSHFEVSTGLPRAIYVFALASNGPLPALSDSAYIDTSDVDEPIRRQWETDSQLWAARADADRATGLLDAARQDFQRSLDEAKHQSEQIAAALRADAAVARSERDRAVQVELTVWNDARAQFDERRRAIEASAAQHLEVTVAAHARNLATAVAELHAGFAREAAARHAEYESLREAARLAEQELRRVTEISDQDRAARDAALARESDLGRRLAETHLDFQTASARVSSLESELAHVRLLLESVTQSSAWRMTWPIRRFGAKHPASARLLGKAARLAWWTVTLQLPREAGYFLRARNNAAAIEASNIFDQDYYKADLPSLRAGARPAIDHYLRGGSARREPHPLFDSAWYVATYPDAASSGLPPLVHYLKKGAGARFDPHPLFESDWYLGQPGVTLENNETPLGHYLRTHGSFDPNPHFTTKWYVGRHPAAAQDGDTPLAHYVRHRNDNTIEPHELFDTAWYETNYPEAKASRLGALAHFLRVGRARGECPNEFFDAEWYLRTYAEVGESGLDPLAHYLRIGSSKGHAPNSWFDASWYLAKNADVRYAATHPFAHYAKIGRAEGRDANGKAAQLRLEEHVRTLGPGIAADERLAIAVGVVTYNNSVEDVARTLRSAAVALALAGQSRSSRVLVIDNGEPVELPDLPAVDVDCLPSRGNIGFGAAHNALMEKAFATGADVYVAANPDGLFHPRSILALAGMASAARHLCLLEAIQFPDEHPKTYDLSDFETSWASGACLWIPRRIYAAIGGFDEDFFMYCEDVDLSWRARAAGFNVKTCPTALYYHATTARPYDAAIHRRFLNAGLTLAYKWRNEAFETLMRDTLASHGWETPDLSLVKRRVGRTDVADFDHMFSFAPTRW